MAQVFDTPIVTTDQSIDRVLAVDLPITLVFLDGGANPALEQAMRRLAQENAGKLLVVKVKVEDSPGAAARFRVGAPPAVVTVRNGQTLSQAAAIGGADLEQHAAFALGKGPRPAGSPRPAASRGAPAAESAPAGGARPLTVTDASFEQDVLRSPQPVLVDFWAPWCGPCRMIEPVVEKLAGELSGRMRVAKVNVDQNPGVAGRYGVQSIPTMMVVKDGQIVERWAGALPEPALRGKVARWVPK